MPDQRWLPGIFLVSERAPFASTAGQKQAKSAHNANKIILTSFQASSLPLTSWELRELAGSYACCGELLALLTSSPAVQRSLHSQDGQQLDGVLTFFQTLAGSLVVATEQQRKTVFPLLWPAPINQALCSLSSHMQRVFLLELLRQQQGMVWAVMKRLAVVQEQGVSKEKALLSAFIQSLHSLGQDEMVGVMGCLVAFISAQLPDGAVQGSSSRGQEQARLLSVKCCLHMYVHIV